MTEHFRISDYIGARVFNDAKKTKLWTMMSALDRVLYSLQTTTDPGVIQHSDQVPRFFGDAKQYVGYEAGWGEHKFHWLTNIYAGKTGRDQYHWVVDVPMLLRDITHELERLAILEVTR